VPSEPSLIDDLLANPLALPLAGGLVALLVGLGVYRLRSRTKKDSGETSFLESRLQPDSFFGASGGQRVDTKDASGAPSSLSYSLSQLDAIGDVDPVAEADVYLAYGRDLQAEEILKEAMRANPERLAIRTKLLEVYAKRRDSKGFELLATQLYGLTAGQGEDWARAQELGRQIDPDNKLYQPGGAPAESAKLPEGGYEPLGASTMPQSVMPTPSKFSDAPPAKGDIDLDLDLPLDNEAPARAFDTEATKPLAAAPVAVPAFSTPAPSVTDEPDAGMSFELPELPAVDTPAVQARSEGPSSRSMDFDLGDISLDLGSTAPGRGTPADELAGLDLGEGGDESGDPMERKLELAEEFRQIGDREGARELLQEVVSKSSGALRAKAQSMLAELA
jgi:pilus assembly protein FimV